MNFSDKPEFRKKLVELATVVGRTITSEEAKAYFNQLEEYPINLLIKAMDKALHDRDPADVFLKTMLVTVPEITTAIEEITKRMPGEESRVSKCKKCAGGGWITWEDRLKRIVARPCECLYEEAKKTIKKKGKPSHLDAYRKRTIGAYEHHQKQWGPEPEIQEKK